MRKLVKYIKGTSKLTVRARDGISEFRSKFLWAKVGHKCHYTLSPVKATCATRQRGFEYIVAPRSLLDRSIPRTVAFRSTSECRRAPRYRTPPPRSARMKYADPEPCRQR